MHYALYHNSQTKTGLTPSSLYSSGCCLYVYLVTSQRQLYREFHCSLSLSRVFLSSSQGQRCPPRKKTWSIFWTTGTSRWTTPSLSWTRTPLATSFTPTTPHTSTRCVYYYVAIVCSSIRLIKFYTCIVRRGK